MTSPRSGSTISWIDAVHHRVNVGATRADGWGVIWREWSIAPDKRIDRDRIPLSAPRRPADRAPAPGRAPRTIGRRRLHRHDDRILRHPLAPGDPFSYDSARITPAVRAEWRARFGYDQPLIVQYGRYLWSVAHGHLGYSTLEERTTVATALAEALPRTLALAGLGLVLSFIIGVVVGTAQAARRGGWFDRITSYVLLVLYSIPDFWGALIILLVFAYWWQGSAGDMVDAMHDYMPPGRAFADRLSHLVLPARLDRSVDDRGDQPDFNAARCSRSAGGLRTHRARERRPESE